MIRDLIRMETMRYLKDASRERPSEAGRTPPVSPASKVLVLTAAAGGGHEAAGRAVRAELERAGYSVAIADGLRVMNRVLNWLLVRGYEEQIRHTPGSMGAIFSVTSRKGGAAIIRGIVALLFAGRLLKIVRRERPDLVVSTYPLVTAALGRLHGSGRLRTPVVAVIADYGAHPLWITPKADLHLVVSRLSAGLARQAGGKASVARLPVAPGFYSAPPREGARAALGISQEAFVVLIVGGAFGAGDLEGAARCVVESGAYAIIVAGSNEGLEAGIRARFGAREDVLVLGWTEEMPALMAAADCLIQNAGGMTCIEAIEMGLPMLMYNPVPGHGELNARVMEQAGVACQVHSAEELGRVLRSAVRREISLSTPNREDAPAVSTILGLLIDNALARPTPSRQAVWLRLGLAGAVLLFLWLVLSRDGVVNAENNAEKQRARGYAKRARIR